ncbi:MAG: ABC transporter ATP-binding protein [Bacteroidetes bacterium]|nr:MAG: ABC transporter ATP-binding protein [Bacteroidota bacterium]
MNIHIRQLKKQYSGHTVLDIPELDIASGELLGIVGNNGAGKTTMLRLGLDLIEANEGHISIGDEKVNEGTHWKRHTGSFLDEGFLIGFLTPEEYFYFNGEVYGLSNAQVDEGLGIYKKFLSEDILGTDKYIRQLSTGNKQKVGIVAAMVVNPSVLMLDEPFNFLDPSSQIIIRNMIRNMNKNRGTTMLISSHNINHLADICSRVILLEKGLIIKDIRPDDTVRLEEVEAYFASQAG